MDSTFIRCRATLRSKMGYYLALIVYPLAILLLSYALVALVVDIVINSKLTVEEGVAFLLFPIFSIIFMIVFFIKLSIRCFRLETRRIAFEKAGFTVRDREDRRYTWDQVSGIGVIAYGASASKEIYQTEICIFLEPITKKDLKKLRDSYLYGAFHPEKFVFLDHTPSALEAVSKCCPFPISDYCDEQIKL